MVMLPAGLALAGAFVAGFVLGAALVGLAAAVIGDR